eukprot:3597031-Pyramimonas_sp.AAC.1
MESTTSTTTTDRPSGAYIASFRSCIHNARGWESDSKTQLAQSCWSGGHSNRMLESSGTNTLRCRMAYDVAQRML